MRFVFLQQTEQAENPTKSRQPIKKSNIMIKKDVTYGDWRIVRHDDSKMEVYKNGELCPKSAPALREIAEEVGLEVNPDWRTSQLGSNVIKAVEAALANQKYKFPISDELKETLLNIKFRMVELGMNSFVILDSDYCSWAKDESYLEIEDFDLEYLPENTAASNCGWLAMEESGDDDTRWWVRLDVVREIKLINNDLIFVVDRWYEGEDCSESEGMNELDLNEMSSRYEMEKIESVLANVYECTQWDILVEGNQALQGLQ